MSKEFTAYVTDKEVLLYDGLEFLVLDLKFHTYEQNLQVAHFKLYNLAIQKVPKKMQSIKHEMVKQKLNN